METSTPVSDQLSQQMALQLFVQMILQKLGLKARSPFLGVCVLAIAVWSLVILASVTALAERVVLVDLDGSVLEDRFEGNRHGRFGTPFILFRVSSIGLDRSEMRDLPQQIEVMPWVYHRLMAEGNALARDQNSRGRLRGLVDNGQGQRFTPGYYYARGEDSVALFMTHDQDQLRHDYQAGLDRITQEEGTTVRGPFFTFAQALLSSEGTAAIFRIFSARDHSEGDWRNLFDLLRERREIRFSPDVRRNILSIGAVRFGGLGATIAERKAGLVHRYFEHLRAVPLENNKPHQLLVVDDSPENLRAIVREVQASMKAKLAPVKVLIFNAGNTTQVEELRKEYFIPQFSVALGDGSFRRATRDDVVEFFGGEAALTKEQVDLLDELFGSSECDRALGKSDRVRRRG